MSKEGATKRLVRSDELRTGPVVNGAGLSGGRVDVHLAIFSVGMASGSEYVGSEEHGDKVVADVARSP